MEILKGANIKVSLNHRIKKLKSARDSKIVMEEGDREV